MQNNISKTKLSVSAVFEYIAGAMPFIFIFIASLARPVDLDLGWHLKYGEYFIKTGTVLRDNIFSVEMPSYHYINHSWATDVFVYLVFNKFGFVGISIAGAVIMACAFYFFARFARFTLWEEAFIFPALLYASYQNIGMSLRGQLLSIAFLGALCFLIRKFEDKRNIFTLLFVIPLFLAWANMHGQFIVGLAVLGAWCVLKCIELFSLRYREKKIVEWRQYAPPIVGILSILATLINPFGWKLYEEVFRHLGNPLQKFVNEWGPIYTNTFLLWAYIILGVILIFGIWLFYKNKSKTEYLYVTVPVIIFWVLAFQQKRYFWPALFMAMPFYGAVIAYIKPQSKKIAYGVAASIIVCVYIFVSVFVLPSGHIFSMDWGYYCRLTGCSPASAEYVIKNKLSGNMLTDYNYGGWLIWNYPEIKPTIDGRMSFWRDDTGYSAFQKYVALENNFSDIDNSEYDIVYISPNKKNIFDRLQQLASAGKWSVAYHDLFSYIFIRNK